MNSHVVLLRSAAIRERLYPQALDWRCPACKRRFALPRWERDTDYEVTCVCEQKHLVTVHGDACGVTTH